MLRTTVFAVSLFSLLVLGGCSTLKSADLDAILDSMSQGELDEGTVLAGLKDALKVGTKNAVASTSSEGGFQGNSLIRIGLPEQLESAASTLRSVGLGSYVGELETAMNRAAELASGEAQSLFWEAVTSMTIEDAFGILNGNETAATDFFRGRTEEQLRSRFEPIVAAQTETVGLGRLYGDLATKYESLPFTGKPQLVDLDAYVTNEALSGLFTVLAQEETAIRNDPAARTTELLRRVFGQ